MHARPVEAIPRPPPQSRSRKAKRRRMVDKQLPEEHSIPFGFIGHFDPRPPAGHQGRLVPDSRSAFAAGHNPGDYDRARTDVGEAEYDFFLMPHPYPPQVCNRDSNRKSVSLPARPACSRSVPVSAGVGSSPSAAPSPPFATKHMISAATTITTTTTTATDIGTATALNTWLFFYPSSTRAPFY